MALAGIRIEHHYQTCRDDDCQLFPCRVYKEGRRRGFDEGVTIGEASGYAAGFEDGILACPGPHNG